MMQKSLAAVRAWQSDEILFSLPSWASVTARVHAARVGTQADGWQEKVSGWLDTCHDVLICTAGACIS
jgi:hypothetical protein